MDNNLTITKELFIETIEKLKDQHEHDSKCSDAFKVILPNDYISCYSNDLIFNQLTKLLKLATGDDHKDSWIEYYIWELDFGKKYHDGCVKIYGENVELKTPIDLWNLLNNIIWVF